MYKIYLYVCKYATGSDLDPLDFWAVPILYNFRALYPSSQLLKLIQCMLRTVPVKNVLFYWVTYLETSWECLYQLCSHSKTAMSMQQSWVFNCVCRNLWFICTFMYHYLYSNTQQTPKSLYIWAKSVCYSLSTAFFNVMCLFMYMIVLSTLSPPRSRSVFT